MSIHWMITEENLCILIHETTAWRSYAQNSLFSCPPLLEFSFAERYWKYQLFTVVILMSNLSTTKYTYNSYYAASVMRILLYPVYPDLDTVNHNLLTCNQMVHTFTYANSYLLILICVQLVNKHESNLKSKNRYYLPSNVQERELS